MNTESLGIKLIPDQGEISVDNSRLINQSHLGLLFPDFIPQLVVGDDPMMKKARTESCYPQQEIIGPTWDEISKRKDLSLEIPIKVALSTTLQIHEISTSSGVILIDRHLGNVMLSPSRIATQIMLDKQYWNVWQVDIQYLYDGVNDSYEIPDSDDLETRSINKVLKRPEAYTHAEKSTAKNILEGVIASCRRAANSRVLTQQEQKVHEMLENTYCDWDSRWAGNGDLTKISFNELESMLNNVTVLFD